MVKEQTCAKMVFSTNNSVDEIGKRLKGTQLHLPLALLNPTIIRDKWLAFETHIRWKTPRMGLLTHIDNNNDPCSLKHARISEDIIIFLVDHSEVAVDEYISVSFSQSEDGCPVAVHRLLVVDLGCGVDLFVPLHLALPGLGGREAGVG